MSKLAMHVQHYKAGAVGAIDRHNKRLGDSHSNELIVPERSGDNIAVLRPDRDLYVVAKDIADHAAGRVTKNSVLVSEWIIYPQEDLQDPATADPERLRAWGNDVIEWMKENGITPKSATIHRDETTNHIHVDTIPLTSDGRLSRKELYTREKLREYHTSLAEHLQARGWDIQRGESTEDRQVRSKNVREFKQQQEAQKREAQRLIEEAKREAVAYQQEASRARSEAKKASQELLDVKNELEVLSEPITNIREMDEIAERTSTSITGGKRIRKTKDDDILIDAAKHGAAADTVIWQQSREIADLKMRAERKDRALEQLKADNRTLERENSELRQRGRLMEIFLKTSNLWERYNAWKHDRDRAQAQQRKIDRGDQNIEF